MLPLTIAKPPLKIFWFFVLLFREWVSVDAAVMWAVIALVVISLLLLLLVACAVTYVVWVRTIRDRSSVVLFDGEPSPAAVMCHVSRVADQGVCKMCDATVRFLLERDSRGLIRFAPLQSKYGQEQLRLHNVAFGA